MPTVWRYAGSEQDLAHRASDSSAGHALLLAKDVPRADARPSSPLLTWSFIAWLAVSLRALGGLVPLLWSVVLWLSLPLVSCAITTLLPGFAAVAWREGWWTRRARIGYSTFTALAVTFMVFLNYWKVLGIRY